MFTNKSTFSKFTLKNSNKFKKNLIPTYLVYYITNKPWQKKSEQQFICTKSLNGLSFTNLIKDNVKLLYTYIGLTNLKMSLK